MPLKIPRSMDECLYFSNRFVDDGQVIAWVYRVECPKCHKAKMGKPIVKDKVKIRAKEYVCHECGHTEDKKEHEESLTLEAKYTCPYCGKEGEGATPYVRKNFKGVPSYIIDCEHCSEKIPITKKLKKINKK